MTASTPRLLVEGLAFPEAPRWRDGALYLSDQVGNRVCRLRSGVLEALCDVPHGASGLGWDAEGALLIVSMHDQRLLRLGRDGALHVAADLAALASGPLNDLVADAGGGVYVGSFGSDLAAGEPLPPATLLRVDPNGRARVVAEDLCFPNGMAITPDGRPLIVAESFAQRLTAFDVAADGGLRNRRVWAQLGPETAAPETFADAVALGSPIPDGIALDADGCVWIADPLGPAALRVREGGEVVGRFETGELSSYAVALGGEDRRTLYACVNLRLDRIDPSSDRRGGVIAGRVEVPGAGRPRPLR
jgi:sugar lactone lactonase YvrE